MSKLVVIILLCFLAVSAKAVPLDLTWDAVTQNTDGSPVAGPVQYKIYKKPQLGEWAAVWTTKNVVWTWLVPSLGRYTFRVTAVDANGTESEPSNELKVIVERIGREDK